MLRYISGIKTVNNHEVKHSTDIDNHNKNDYFIYVDHEKNTVTMKIQPKPIVDIGIKGIQVHDMIEFSRQLLIKLNADNQCFENCLAISGCLQATSALRMRKERIKASILTLEQVGEL